MIARIALAALLSCFMPLDVAPGCGTSGGSDGPPVPPEEPSSQPQDQNDGEELQVPNG